MATGKSTLSRALGARLGWPVVDKDDANDVLIRRVPDSGALAYEVMFSVAGSLLEQGFSVICDSPLRSAIGLANAQRLAVRHDAELRVLELTCWDEALWRQRLEQRFPRPAQLIRSWDAFLPYRQAVLAELEFPIPHPTLTLDAARPLEHSLARALEWLERD